MCYVYLWIKSNFCNFITMQNIKIYLWKVHLHMECFIHYLSIFNLILFYLGILSEVYCERE